MRHFYRLQGVVRYYDDYCVAYVDPELSKYYLSLIPKAWDVRPQMWRPHVTIVRKWIESDHVRRAWWGYRDGEAIDIKVRAGLQADDTYIWLNAVSRDIVSMRRVLGLPAMRKGFNVQHITVGNVKHMKEVL